MTLEPDRERSGTVVNIQRMSTEDGPGLRTTLFLKGCSLACCWCHNPETLSPKPRIVWHDWKCAGFGACLTVCPENAISRCDGTVRIDSEACTMCGDCARECPTTAIEILGVCWELDDLVAEVLKDRSYFEASGGGVTVSGGEPGLQPVFTAALLDRLRAESVHAALDTCGLCSPAALATLAGKADLVLYDVKEIDAERHTRFTGQSNVRILANLLELGRQVRSGSGAGLLWVRTPLVPGATATEENVRGIGAFLVENLADVVSRWELCAFNNLARDKYRRLGVPWEFERTELLTRDELRHFEEVARGSGFDPCRIVATGPTAVESPSAEDGAVSPAEDHAH
jgi:pyruvate formate lyase activating enzyme